MSIIQHSLFEDGYLRRDLRAVAEKPEVAIAELVANAWDAGASEIDILVPDCLGGVISISDNGVGLTPKQFRERWMKHGYNRTKHQGRFAEFPPDRSDWKRMAYGRNGIGRHGLLCFAEEYAVETKRYDENTSRRYFVKPSSGESAFDLVSEETVKKPTSGTIVWTKVEFKLPDRDIVNSCG
jgi:HSP90 family molecular chaperone